MKSGNLNLLPSIERHAAPCLSRSLDRIWGAREHVRFPIYRTRGRQAIGRDEKWKLEHSPRTCIKDAELTGSMRVPRLSSLTEIVDADGHEIYYEIGGTRGHTKLDGCG